MNEEKVIIQNKYLEKLVGIKTIPTLKKNKYPTVLLIQ
jgi:hypothetical protein